MNAMTCPHGYFDNADAAQSCGICVHLPGECDWGGCHDPARVAVETLVRGQGVVERRPMCDRSADTVSDEALQQLIGPGTVLVRVAGKRASYEAVMFNDVTARSNNVKLARVEARNGRIREVSRYVAPDALLELVVLP